MTVSPILVGWPSREIQPQPCDEGRHVDWGIRSYASGASQWYVKVRGQHGKGRHRG